MNSCQLFLCCSQLSEYHSSLNTTIGQHFVIYQYSKVGMNHLAFIQNYSDQRSCIQFIFWCFWSFNCILIVAVLLPLLKKYIQTQQLYKNHPTSDTVSLVQSYMFLCCRWLFWSNMLYNFFLLKIWIKLTHFYHFFLFSLFKIIDLEHNNWIPFHNKHWN